MSNTTKISCFNFTTMQMDYYLNSFNDKNFIGVKPIPFNGNNMLLRLDETFQIDFKYGGFYSPSIIIDASLDMIASADYKATLKRSRWKNNCYAAIVLIDKAYYTIRGLQRTSSEYGTDDSFMVPQIPKVISGNAGNSSMCGFIVEFDPIEKKHQHIKMHMYNKNLDSNELYDISYDEKDDCIKCVEVSFKSVAGFSKSLKVSTNHPMEYINYVTDSEHVQELISRLRHYKLKYATVLDIKDINKLNKETCKNIILYKIQPNDNTKDFNCITMDDNYNITR